MEIRKMKSTDDRLAISRIYEESWKFAYQNIIPESFLKSIPAGRWASSIDKDDRETLVIVENDTFIGTSSFGKSRFHDFENFGEIISIYLLPEYMGKGYGKKLIYTVIHELKLLGYHDIFLWVLEENERARKFYERVGFHLSDNYLDDMIGGRALREVQYHFHIE